MEMKLSLLTFPILLCWICIALFGVFASWVSAALDKTDMEVVDGMVQEAVAAEVNTSLANVNWTIVLEQHLNKETLQRIVIQYLKDMDWNDAFKRTTGNDMTTVLIIIACVMILPGLIFNVILLVCLTVLKGSTKAVTETCCCCKKIICCGK